MKKGLVAIVSATVLFGSAYQAAAAYEPGTNAQKLVVIENHNKNAANLQVTKEGYQSAPSFISGNISKDTYLSKEDILTFLKNNNKLFSFDAKKNVTFVSETKDSLGMKHYVFNLSINGVPVDDARLFVHTDQHGKITAINHDVQSNLPTDGKAAKKLSKETAIQKAWKHVGEAPKKEVKPLAVKGASPNSLGEKAKLVMVKDGNDYKLAYRVALQYIAPTPANWQVYVDATDGHIIKSRNDIMDDGAETGSGKGVLGDTKSLNTTSSKGSYYLSDGTKGMGGNHRIETYDAANVDYTSDQLPGTLMKDSDNKWTSSEQAAAVDAHFYAGKVYDYYKKTFGRNSFDGKGSSLISSVHVGSDWNNAVWNGQQMLYGDGDGREFGSLAGALDVVAHELTHAVTEYSANLKYEGQSGALNESMSDVFGYFLDPSDWWVGEDVYTPGKSGDGLRNLQKPELGADGGQPSHMKNYVNTSEDDGGVHTNSGIPNKAAYLTISAMGQAKAEKVYYRALTTYMTSSTNFSGARAALLSATADLFGKDGTEYNAVKTAWSNVGVN
ncbi:peptidase M4 thermolysin [Fictibacillus macauensis ZFHKF-1]|uniref:Neutral metalloproteinase n=1 Tax=Fictibacillus macauensis ZFHKF-1 TaxID=1196324 RepID=I8UFI7_9BACL|nr:M4 family metallopeptidase [Fictibacillus macauensis]EIT85660.1 peptidase M4 thermolysin [Fictibacillus macauensis ZFHKF-1]